MARQLAKKPSGRKTFIPVSLFEPDFYLSHRLDKDLLFKRPAQGLIALYFSVGEGRSKSDAECYAKAHAHSNVF
jgi:hypothetical protein